MAGTVDEYLAALPDDVRARVEEVRRVVHEVVPDAGETISYAMPTFTLDDQPLLHVAAWKQHIGIYPLPPLAPELDAEVAPYRGSKDTMKLPHSRPLPRDLVAVVVGALAERRRAGD
ncbi:MAG: uncharacterized protein JWR66_455 [Modestobacter sp.]|jgi:uncharacterized protein YdhG (YjbR/CyaY superfamily)|nr:uncharacterized protein [Modestobacter sp.]MCW2574425.1 uncharacterized protein [Modestobacter sp.]